MDAVFSLSIEDAERIAWAVALVWAIAYSVKLISKLLR